MGSPDLRRPSESPALGAAKRELEAARAARDAAAERRGLRALATLSAADPAAAIYWWKKLLEAEPAALPQAAKAVGAAYRTLGRPKTALKWYTPSLQTVFVISCVNQSMRRSDLTN